MTAAIYGLKGERTYWWEYKPMRRVGFAPWDGYPRIDDPSQDDETFDQQAERLRDILMLPDDGDWWGEPEL